MLATVAVVADQAPRRRLAGVAVPVPGAATVFTYHDTVSEMRKPTRYWRGKAPRDRTSPNAVKLRTVCHLTFRIT